MKAIAVVSEPFIPKTSQQLWQTLNLPGTVHQSKWNDAMIAVKSGHEINKPQPLFHKIDSDEATLDEQLAKVRNKLGPK